MSDLADLIAHLRKDADYVDRDTYDGCWEIKETDRGKRLRAASTALAALVAERDRYREALKPFAEWADHYRATTHDHYVPECEIDGPGHSLTITLGEFRRARAALAQGGEP